jgi:hypothetical protein
MFGYNLSDNQLSEILGGNITSYTDVSPTGSTTLIFPGSNVLSLLSQAQLVAF